MFALISLLGFMLISVNWAHNEILSTSEFKEHIPLVKAALHVTKRYISSVTNTLIILEKCEFCQIAENNYHGHVLDYFLKDFQASMAVQLFYSEADEKPWDFNLFIVNSFYAFESLRFHFPLTLHDRRFYFFIILTLKISAKDLYNVMLDIMKSCESFNVNNVVIMREDAENANIFNFYSYKLFDSHHCQDVLHVEKINRYVNGSMEHDFLFPKLLNNLHNCWLNVSANSQAPFLHFNGNSENLSHTRDLSRLSGIDGDILKLLAEILNFRINLKIHNIQRSVIGTHGNSTGCFAELAAGIANVVIGAFSNTRLNHNIFSTSASYHQTPFVFIVKSGLHFGPLKQLANPFKLQVWLMIGIILLIAIGVIVLVKLYASDNVNSFILGSNNHSAVLNLFSALLGNPIFKLPRRNFARFILMAWILTALVVRNAYQGKMFNALRVSSRLPLPRTITELITHRYIMISNTYVNYYPENMTVLIPFLARRFSIVQGSAELYVTAAALDTIAYYNSLHWNSSRLTFLEEPIFVLQLAIYFRKHSIFKTTFDEKLKRLLASGMIARIVRRYVRKEFHAINKNVPKLPSISNSLLRGIYTIYMMVNFNALLIFGFELMSKKSRLVKRGLDYMHGSAT